MEVLCDPLGSSPIPPMEYFPHRTAENEFLFGRAEDVAIAHVVHRIRVGMLALIRPSGARILESPDTDAAGETGRIARPHQPIGPEGVDDSAQVRPRVLVRVFPPRQTGMPTKPATTLREFHPLQ